MHRLVTLACTSAAGILAATAAAHAAPVNSPRAELLDITCPGRGQFTIVPAPGQGEWTPGLLVGTRKVLVPYRFTFTFSDTEGNSETETTSKRAPVPAGSVTCTFSESFTEDGVTYTFDGTVTGPLRGKP